MRTLLVLAGLPLVVGVLCYVRIAWIFFKDGR